MTRRPRLLDLFCGAGGASKGYHDAGFDVTGVDNRPQPSYPYAFIQADAMTYPLDGYDVIHASPPCQAYTTANARWRNKGGDNYDADSHLSLLEPTAQRLRAQSTPYVIENVLGARRHFAPTLSLNGRMFGLAVWRPRLFECSALIMAPARTTPRGRPVIGVYGEAPNGRLLSSRYSPHTGNRAASSLDEGRAAMGIDWMNWRELCESIPPAYTAYIGAQLLGLFDRI